MIGGMVGSGEWIEAVAASALNAGAPVTSAVFPVGHATREIRNPDKLADQPTGKMGFHVKFTLVGTATDNVDLNIYPRDFPSVTFPVHVASWGRTYGNGSNPFNVITTIPVELVGIAASLEFVRVANSNNLTVQAWIMRYHYL
jgi:hypothetical protein